MTDRIPEEIMREAVRTLAVARAHTAFLNSREQDAIAKHIARALMARDQRAAEIARRKIVSGIYAGTAEWPDGEDIADAILTYDEAQP